MLDSLFAQPLSKSSLVYLLVWNPQLHTPYISSPNHCSLCNTCLFYCSTKIMSSIPSLSLDSLLNVTHASDYSHLCPLKCHLILFPYRPDLTSMQHTTCTQLFYSLTLIINVISIPFSWNSIFYLNARHTSIWLFSTLHAEVPLHFPILQARSHFHAAYYFAHNFCTIKVHKSHKIPQTLLNVWTKIRHPFNGPLSGTTQVSSYQKGKTNLDLLEQEKVNGSGISLAICKSAPRPDT